MRYYVLPPRWLILSPIRGSITCLQYALYALTTITNLLSKPTWMFVCVKYGTPKDLVGRSEGRVASAKGTVTVLPKF
jgi:hypothetical protein